MPTVLDLFSGCGGLSLGAKQAGYSTELAVDIDPILSASFPHNFPKTQLLRADVASLDRGRLRSMLPRGVDGIIGGPPCQAFSEIGRRLEHDSRRTLVAEFFRIVSILRPAFFMMENVRGLGFPRNRPLLDAAIEQLDGSWEIIGPLLLDAANFGAPTKRQRLFVFGFNPHRMDIPTIADICGPEDVRTTVRDAIADLSDAKRESADASGVGLWRYGNITAPSRYAKTLRSRRGIFSGHQQTMHSPATAERFSTIAEGGIDPIGKHQRLAWNGQCPVIRAGTGKDRGSYQSVRPLHPVEHRVITPREAARLQGFPDDFLFHPTIWHSFRMIGNSVSPIMAAKILKNIRPFFVRHPSHALPLCEHD